MIYHELGVRFLSPTVNLWFTTDDYLKLIAQPKKYLLSVPEYDVEMSEQVGYPVGDIKGIRAFFLHYNNFEDAREKWIQRAARINWDNVFYIMVQGDHCTREKLEMFDSIKPNDGVKVQNRVVFTDNGEYNNIKSAYHISGTEKVENEGVIDLCMYKSKFTGRRWIDDFDYVRFLNG